jgi:hypothetical protein
MVEYHTVIETPLHTEKEQDSRVQALKAKTGGAHTLVLAQGDGPTSVNLGHEYRAHPCLTPPRLTLATGT